MRRRDVRSSPFFVGGEEFAVLSVPMVDNGLLDALSAAEREVARLLLEGNSNAAIARERGTSPRTVANQLAALYRKLGVRSRAELAARVIDG